MNIARAIACGTVFLCGLCLMAEPVYVWTGAVDGKWTQPGNWTVKGSDPAVSPTADELAAEAVTFEFATVSNGRTTIDLEGAGVISNIVIVAGAPKYTFGTSAEQELAQSLPGGRFEVSQGAAAPHIVAKHGWSGTSTGSATALSVINNSADVLVMDQAFARPQSVQYYTSYSGTGDIRIDGTATDLASIRIKIGLTGKGRLVWNAVGKTFEKLEAPAGADAVFELGEGVEIKCGGGYYKFLVGEKNGAAKLRITGPGSLKFEAVTKNTGSVGHYMEGPVNVEHADSELTFDTEITSAYYEDQDFHAGIYLSGPKGSAVITRTNSLRGFVKLLGEISTAKLSVGSIGFGKEIPSFLGYADILAAGNNILRYTGAGETCNRSLIITNMAPVQANKNDSLRSQAAQIWHDGTGALVWQGEIDAPGLTGESTITLGGASAAAATLDMVLADSSAGGKIALKKVGSGIWRLTASCTYTGSTTISGGILSLGPAGELKGTSLIDLAGGSLSVEGGDTARSVTMPPVKMTNGDATLRVGGATTLIIDSLTYGAGTLNVVADDVAAVKLTGYAGTAPAWLKWKGVAVTVDEEGNVLPSAVTAVAAKGDEIGDVDGTVAIVEVGTGENTSLASDNVALGTLKQMIQYPAVIAIGEGRTLTVGELNIAESSGDLTVGEKAAEGVIAGADGVLELSSDSPGSSLTINAAIADGTDVKMTRGAATLGGGTAGSADLLVSKGAIRLTGEDTLKFDSIGVGRGSNEATLVLDGAKDVRFGNGGLLLGFNDESGSRSLVRMVITNSTITGCADDHEWAEWGDDFGTFVIGRRRNAIVEVQADSLVSNILSVGVVPVNENTDRWYTGHLRQRGGEVRPAAGRPGVGIGGRYGCASYLMEGGLLQPVEYFNIGNYSHGTLDIRGGSVVYPEYVKIAAENGSSSCLLASGGKMTVATDIRFTSASLGANSFMVLEKNADVAAAQVIVSRPKSGYSSCARLALNGGALSVVGFKYAENTDASGNSECSIGFGGGTLRTAGSYNDIFKYANDAGGIPSVTVYAGGCTIDTNGKNGNYSTVEFAGAHGKGVASVTMPEASYDAYCAPMIVISGDGYGALALPVWDCDTLTFSGVRIVQPGVGYTWAKVTAYRSDTDTFFKDVDCVLSDNVNSGSFTKAGEGTFVLEAANTYGGDTVLKGGILTAKVAGALPPGTTVVFAGGTLSLGDGVDAPMYYAVDYGVSSQATVSIGDYVFPEGATLEIRGLPPVDILENADLLDLGSGYEGPKPTVEFPQSALGDRFTIGWRGSVLRLRERRGFRILVR